MDNPVVIASLIGAMVAAAGLIVQVRQLNLRVRELEEQNRQDQLVEILKKRLDCYPLLWKAIIEHTVNWSYKGGSRDVYWANNFLQALDEWNLDFGIFLSRAANLKFLEMRSFLVRAVWDLGDQGEISEADFRDLYYIFVGDPVRNIRGLGTQLKNDLGGYRIAAVQTSPDERKKEEKMRD